MNDLTKIDSCFPIFDENLKRRMNKQFLLNLIKAEMKLKNKKKILI